MQNLILSLLFSSAFKRILSSFFFWCFSQPCEFSWLKVLSTFLVCQQLFKFLFMTVACLGGKIIIFFRKGTHV